MKGRSPNIFLGDLARAVRGLGIKDDQSVALVAQMLGLRMESPAEPGRRRGAGGAGGDRPGPEKRPDRKGKEEGEEFEEEAADGTPGVSTRAVPVEVEFRKAVREGLLPEVEVKPFPAQEPNIDVSPPPLDPLFTPHWTRGILSAALATSDEEALLDVEGAAEVLARSEPLERLPVLPSRTMRRGVRLLLDAGRAMMPFERDQIWLTLAIQRVVGESHVQVSDFVGTPLRAEGPGGSPRAKFRPPPPGTPVVLLTDLGICRAAARTGDAAGEGEWLAFCEEMRRAGCPLIALVPYKPSRWPRRLARRMTIVQWDRATTAATVGKIFRRHAEATRP